MPAPVVEALSVHLSEVPDGDDQLVFTGDKGGPIRRSNLNKALSWKDAVEALGVPGLHFHDLRHTGNVLAAGTGASLRNLMLRMGHDSMRAALIYQHATQNADQQIADALTVVIEAEQPAAGTKGE